MPLPSVEMSLPPPPPTQQQTCYRHPAVVTGRQCTRCGKPACADCLVQAAVGSHCRDCAKAARPDIKTRARYWQSGQQALVTMGLILANCLVFAYTTIQDPRSLTGQGITLGQAQLGLYRDALANITSQVRLWNGTIYTTNGNDWYRMVSSGFLHFGIIHLLMNMYLLYVLGRMLEPMIGRTRFALVYLASLLGGSALAVIMQGDSIAGGASGAVFGLIGVAAVAYYRRGQNPLTTSIGSLLILNLVFTFMIPGISIGGHLGGLLAGALSGWIVAAPPNNRIPAWARSVTPIVVGLAAIAATVVTVVISP